MSIDVVQSLHLCERIEKKLRLHAGLHCSESGFEDVPLARCPLELHGAQRRQTLRSESVRNVHICRQAANDETAGGVPKHDRVESLRHSSQLQGARDHEKALGDKPEQRCSRGDTHYDREHIRPPATERRRGRPVGNQNAQQDPEPVELHRQEAVQRRTPRNVREIRRRCDGFDPSPSEGVFPRQISPSGCKQRRSLRHGAVDSVESRAGIHHASVNAPNRAGATIEAVTPRGMF